MARTLASLALASAIYAAFVALFLNGIIALLSGVLAVAAAVFCFLNKDRVGMISGIVLALFGIFSIVAVLGGINTEDAQAGNFSPAFGQASAVTAGMLVVVAVVSMNWQKFEPEWMGFAAAGLAVVAIVLAFVFQVDLGGLTGAAAAVAVPALLAGVAPGWLLRGS